MVSFYIAWYNLHARQPGLQCRGRNRPAIQAPRGFACRYTSRKKIEEKNTLRNRRLGTDGRENRRVEEKKNEHERADDVVTPFLHSTNLTITLSSLRIPPSNVTPSERRIARGVWAQYRKIINPFATVWPNDSGCRTPSRLYSYTSETLSPSVFIRAMPFILYFFAYTVSVSLFHLPFLPAFFSHFRHTRRPGHQLSNATR